MKMRILVLLSILCIFWAGATFAYTQDTGRILQVFVNPAGNIAFTIDGNGFQNARATYGCSTSANGFAGGTGFDPVFKSAILAAKATGVSVTVMVDGCTSGGGWFKILDMYVNEK